MTHYLGQHKKVQELSKGSGFKSRLRSLYLKKKTTYKVKQQPQLKVKQQPQLKENPIYSLWPFIRFGFLIDIVIAFTIVNGR